MLGIMQGFSIIHAQIIPDTTEISGIVNGYSRVYEFYERREGSDVNAVKVEDTSVFAHGDVVMLYVAKGWHIEDSINEVDKLEPGEASFREPHPNVGAYSINKVDSILLKDNIIVFVAPTPFRDSLRGGEMAQLVRVPSYRNAHVTGTILGQDWSASTGEGGVIALYVEGNLIMDADIDATGIGFEGGDPSGDEYEGGCYQDDPDLYDGYFYRTDDDDLAGLKGEGSSHMSFNDSLRGRAPVFNGGGGGNARFSGGGGGSNFNPGGLGGGQAADCDLTSATSGQGGIGLGDEFYYNYTDPLFTPLANRIYFGGGGGTSTQTSEYQATAGGDGGGIVVIIADTIEADNTVAINANGQSVNDVALAGAGGGGGGGAIVLDVSYYKGEIYLKARGGKGGGTNNSFYTGPGGGGGGGIYWLSSDSSNLYIDISESSGGRYLSAPGQSPGQNGTGAEKELGLVPPLNGFLFNTLPNNRTVCTDEVPDTLFASTPKGGGGPGTYEYQWQFKSPAVTQWDSIAADTFIYYVFKDKLTEPVMLRRLVRSEGLEEGGDVSITYSITEQLEENVIGSPDIICSGLTGEALIQDGNYTLQGADMPSDTSFRWIRSVDDGTTWDTATNVFDKKDYVPSGITKSTLYSRIVYSGVCDDTSNAVLITVLPSITTNKIEDSDTICLGQTPGIFTGDDPGGGDGNYTFAWQVSADLFNWGDSLVSSTNQDFSLSEYNQTRYIRRTIYSGEDSACVDISESDTITVLELISENEILTIGDTITICEGSNLPGGGIDGKQAEGGDGMYTYNWQVRTKGTSWTTVSNVEPGTLFNLSEFTDTSYIRREVISGNDDVCQDISDTLVIGMVWKITANQLTSADAVYCQSDALAELTGQTAEGGSNGIGTLWQLKTESGDWEPAPGSNSGWNYSFPDLLDETLYFRRMVWSEPTDSVCIDFGDSVKITVQPEIQNNDIVSINDNILADDLDSICSGLDLYLMGSDGFTLNGGDGVNYSFLWEESSDENFSLIDSTGLDSGYTKRNFRESRYFRRTAFSGECEDTTYLLVRTIQLPTGRLDYAGDQAAEICASDETPVSLIIDPELDPLAKSYTAYVSYIAEQHSGSDSFNFNSQQDPGDIDFTAETDSVETYIYILDSIIDDRNCVSKVLDANEPAIKVYFSPEASITAGDTAVCGPNVSLSATNKGGVILSWLVKSDQLEGSDVPVYLEVNGLTAEASVNEWYNDTAIINYGFKIETSGSLGLTCADSSFVTVRHYQPPKVPPYFMRTDINEQGDSVSIDSVYFANTYPMIIDFPSPSGKGEWSVPEDSYGELGEDPEDPGMIARLGNKLDVDNLYTWTVYNGSCEPRSDDIIVRRKDVQIYEGISPNNDGYNDVLAMRGIKHAEKISFTVFNSWGTPIYRMTETDEEQFVSLIPSDDGSEQLRVLWDGKVNGVVVPDGTYYYNISFSINVGTPRERSYTKKSYLVISTQD